jgi:hypothetical protein
MANHQANPLLARADVVVQQAKLLQAEMDKTIATAELNAHRLERTFLIARAMISRRPAARTSSLSPETQPEP